MATAASSFYAFDSGTMGLPPLIRQAITAQPFSPAAHDSGDALKRGTCKECSLNSIVDSLSLCPSCALRFTREVGLLHQQLAGVTARIIELRRNGYCLLLMPFVRAAIHCCVELTRLQQRKVCIIHSDPLTELKQFRALRRMCFRR